MLLWLWCCEFSAQKMANFFSCSFDKIIHCFWKTFFCLEIYQRSEAQCYGEIWSVLLYSAKRVRKKKCESNCGCNGNRTNWSKQRIPMRHRPHLAHRCDCPPLLAWRSTVHVGPTASAMDTRYTVFCTDFRTNAVRTKIAFLAWKVIESLIIFHE